MIGIDGDLLVYRVGFKAQKELYRVYLKGEEQYLASIEGKRAVNEWLKETGLDKDDVELSMEIVVDKVENALHSVKLMIEGMRTALKEDKYIVYLSGIDNFRYDVLPSYKAGRGPKPVLYDDIREYLISVHDATVVHGMEADDALGIAQQAGVIDCICSYDKDLDTIPGEHYNFVTEQRYYVTEEEAERFYYAQLMAGDGTDNACGIRGVGVVTALKAILKEPDKSPEEVAKQAYMKFWGEDWEEVWECNSQLIRILQE